MDLKRYKLLKAQEINKARCERDEMLDKFLERINTKERKSYMESIGKRYIPLNHSALAGLIRRRFGSSQAGILKNFYADCDNASNFTKYFWWQVKQKPNKELFNN